MNVNGEPCAPRGARTVREGGGIPGLPHDLGVDVARLKLMKASHQSQQYKLEDSLLKKLPEEMKSPRASFSALRQIVLSLNPSILFTKKRFPFQIHLAYQDLILYNNYISQRRTAVACGVCG